MVLLDTEVLHEVNGGSKESYEIGLHMGEGLRKALVACGIIALFI